MLIRVDFHCHTRYSKDSLTSPESLMAASRKKGLDKVVITDHNTIAGAVAARQLDPQRFIVGEEILTQEGELLAFFVSEEVPPGLPAYEAIRRLKAQGAFISVSHPFDVLRCGWLPADLEAILPEIDAIEVFNARVIQRSANQGAQEFALAHRLRGTVGSDAHTAFELGAAYLVLPDFDDAATLRQALPQAERHTAVSPQWVHLFSRLAVWQKALLGGQKRATGA